METYGYGLLFAGEQSTFNFLASLINGNQVQKTIAHFCHITAFNFLASLINGNS